MSKACTKCHQEKSFENFFVDNTRKDRRTPHCKQCALLQQKNRRATAQGQIKQREQNWRWNGIINADGSPFRMPNYSRALTEQLFRCAICAQVKGLVVDHDHTTKKFRGLLCALCNKLLGLAHDNPAALQNAAIYLTKEF